jgi:uncharacterized protein (DUF2235 family)
VNRNLVVCCDGTANEFNKDRTNVLKLAFAAEKDTESQLLYYHPGVGTMAPPGLFTRVGRGIARLAGLAFGYGLKADVRDVYTFIIDHYRPGDRIFLFGFSRGAYTARAVAALLNGYGLIGPGNAALIPYALRLLWSLQKAKTEAAKSAAFDLATDFRKTLSIGECEVHFLGVWDTVSSVGWIANPLALPYTHQLPNVSTVRHAIAIDEKRAFFRTNRVELNRKGDVQEVWFPGVHCDVGGGYEESESGLSKIALRWMLDEAAKAGLKLNPARVAEVLGQTSDHFAKPDPNAKMHKSLTLWWSPAEFVFKKHWDARTKTIERRPNLFRRRTYPSHPVVHDSAWKRTQEPKYIPPGAVPLSEATWPPPLEGDGYDA